MNFQMKMSAIGVGPTVFHIVETIQEILIFMEKLDFSLAEWVVGASYYWIPYWFSFSLIRHEVLDPKEILETIARIVQSVEVFHQTGYIHLDIKPESKSFNFLSYLIFY